MQTLPPASASSVVIPVQAVRVARVTGATPPGEHLPNPNRTDLRDEVFGTDLGILWVAGDGRVMVAFGDTYGHKWGGAGGGPPGADWRSNTLAVSTDADPAHGLVMTMIHDKAKHAGELVSSPKDDREVTLIPTGGVSVGSRQYVRFMSVHHWGRPGLWQTNLAALAYSDDDGKTWTRPAAPVWKNTAQWDDPFQQGAFVKSGGYVYLFGTPNGRSGAVSLARVSGPRLLDKEAYQYWDGRGWRTGLESAAVPVVKGPAGEVSVAYNSFFRRWLMVSLDMARNAIMLRSAAALTGPWSAPQTLVDGASFPVLYGGFIDPLHNDGQDLYFTMSQWWSYNVFWMHSRLELRPAMGGRAAEAAARSEPCDR